MWIEIIIALGILICAFQAIRTPRLLYSALWLACVSAQTALLIYLLGAPEVAVIELSVGAGLVTVLFIFAINITGEEQGQNEEIKWGIPRPLAWALVLAAVCLLAWFVLSFIGKRQFLLEAHEFSQFGQLIWEGRSLDTLLQTLLIFSGVLGILGLLDESSESSQHKEGE